MEVNNKNDESNKKEKWKRNIDFIFNMSGAAIGLGNVWRFPYLCYKNGGGAFLIPYFFFVAVLVVPMFLLETTLGQYTSCSAVQAWKIIPLMRGIGIAGTIICSLSNVYYPVVLTWGLRYLIASFNKVLPWSTCGNSWNTKNCFPVMDESANGTLVMFVNTTNTSKVSSVTEFWQNEVLKITSGVEETGSLKWDLVLCLLVLWILTYFSIWKGIEWTSKIVYFTATLPIIMMVVVLVRGLTLEGAGNGISYFLSPNVTKMAEIQIWREAASQVLYSFIICIGVVTTLGSFNRYHHNLYRDTLVLVGANVTASLLAGFTIFSVLGFLASRQNTTVDGVVEFGPGLVFIAYPTALTMLPLPQLWSSLFFVMILLLGFDGQFVFQEAVLGSLGDLFPRYFQRKWGREIILAVVCALMFALGLPMVTEGGIYVFHLFDNYAVNGWCLLFLCTCQCLTISWLYGADRLCDNITDMMQRRVPLLWMKICWKYITPTVSTVLLIYALSEHQQLTYNRTYKYPIWANAVGWMLSLISTGWIPFYALYAFCTSEGETLREKLKASLRVPNTFLKNPIKTQVICNNDDCKSDENVSML